MTAAAGGTAAAMGAAAAAAPDASPAAAPAAAPGGEPGDSQSATELRRLHSELGAYVPELHQVHHLLEASLALGDNTEVAPMLRQRLRQCEVAALVLSSPLTVVSSRLHLAWKWGCGTLQLPALACSAGACSLRCYACRQALCVAPVGTICASPPRC